MLRAIAHHAVGDRPGRVEPRARQAPTEMSETSYGTPTSAHKRLLQAAKRYPSVILNGTISRHIICSGQLFAQFFRSHPEELPEAQRGQLQAQQAVRRLILSVPGPELV